MRHQWKSGVGTGQLWVQCEQCGLVFYLSISQHEMQHYICSTECPGAPKDEAMPSVAEEISKALEVKLDETMEAAKALLVKRLDEKDRAFFAELFNEGSKEPRPELPEKMSWIVARDAHIKTPLETCLETVNKLIDYCVWLGKEKGK